MGGALFPLRWLTLLKAATIPSINFPYRSILDVLGCSCRERRGHVMTRQRQIHLFLILLAFLVFCLVFDILGFTVNGYFGLGGVICSCIGNLCYEKMKHLSSNK